MNFERRRGRYERFVTFFDNADAWCTSVADSNARFAEFKRIFGFYIVPGGRSGGRNPHLIQVFFGFRPTDQTTYIHQGTDGIPRIGHRVLSESGAGIDYYRRIDGLVACYLMPAWSDEKNVGDVYLLGVYDAGRLEPGATTLYNHFAFLIAYFNCTCLDGAPTVLDHLRVALLKLWKRRLVDGEPRPRRISEVAAGMVRFALTVGMSGCLLWILQHYFSSHG